MKQRNGLKKNIFAISAAFCAFLMAFVFASNNNALISGNAEPAPYSITFNKSTNKLSNRTDVTLVSGETKVKTAKGTLIDFTYTNINCQFVDSWHILAEKGGFYNTTPLKGLTQLKIRFATAGYKFKVYWSERADFVPLYSKEYLTASDTDVICDFNNCFPNFFKVENSSTNWLDVKTVSVTFSCEDEYSEIERRQMYLDKHKYGKSIIYSNDIKNKVSNNYGESDKSKYHIQNQDFSLNYNLTGSKKRVADFSSTLTNKQYVTDTFDTYALNGETKYYASDSVKIGRNNTYDMGYYYYNTHILDQTFGNPSSGVTKYLKLLKKTNVYSHNDIENLKVSITGVLSFDVTSSYDPQVVFKASYAASDYNYLHVKLKSEVSTSFGIYMASSVSGFCAEQFMSCKINNNGSFNDYYVPIGNMVNYSGTINYLRIDIGSTGEHIEISAFEVFKVVDDFSSNFALDRCYHTYGDKLYQEDTVVCLKEGASSDGIGQEIKIAKSTVSQILVKDSDGNYHENSNLTGPNTAAAFLIKDVGIFGVILPYDKIYTLSITSDSSYYYIDISSNSGHKTYSYLAQEKYSFRIYNDINNDFSNFKNEVYVEHNPLTTSIYEACDSASALGYNSTRGCYDFGVIGADINYLYYKAPNRDFKINALITSNTDRKIYVSGNSTNCMFLECSVILDSDGGLLPIPVEVNKNFMGEYEEPIFDPTDALYGHSIAPFEITAGEELKFTMIHLYQKWGQNALKQLSSIKFYSEYYHLSTGLTETNCIAPEMNNYLPDFRSMSAPLWEGQPQHTSFGNNKLTKYVDSSGNTQDMIHLNDVISSSGPSYADITLNNVSTDGKMKATYRHLEMPQSDENRTYYEIDYEILDSLFINDFKNNFSIFSANTRSEQYGSYGYLDSSNTPQVVNRTTDSDFSDVVYLGNNYPYYDIFNCTNKDDYVNLGIIVKNSDITINGASVTPSFVAKNNLNKTAGCNYINFSLNLDNVTFKKGDHLHFEIILLPWGSQNSTDDSNVRNVREDSCLHPYNTIVSMGSLEADTYLPKINADKEAQSAIFTVSNGRNIVTPRIYGFYQIGVPKVQELVGGQWVDYVFNYYDYDGYSMYLDDSKTFSYSFPINMGDSVNNNRTFKVTIA